MASQFGQVVVSKPLKMCMIFLFAVVLMFVVFGGDKFLKMEEEFELLFFNPSNMGRITIYEFK